MQCVCSAEMHWQKYARNVNLPYIWRCAIIKKSVLTGFFFLFAKIDIRTYIMIIYDFCFGLEFSKITERLNICRESVRDIFQHLSTKVSNYLLNQENKK